MGMVIWLTGISGSGKTTLAKRLKDELDRKLNKVEILDGDIVREFFGDDLGYSREDRIFNVKRIALAAMLLAKNGITVIVANIAPFYEVRDFIRSKIPGYIQVYLNASVEKCMERDVKGHYARAKQGEIKDMLGVDDIYDVPRNPHLVLDTDNSSIDECMGKLVDYLAGEKINKHKFGTESFKLIVTVGPTSLKKNIIKSISETGSCIFRINGAHSNAGNVKEVTDHIRGVLPEAEIMLDLPGNKIRLGDLGDAIKLEKGKIANIYSHQLNYPDFYKIVKPGEVIMAQDSTLMLEVLSVKNKVVELISHSNGLLESRRGFHVKGIYEHLPFLFDKDIELIKTACGLGIDYLGLSFVRSAKDIRLVKEKIRGISSHAPQLIAKIETLKAVENMEEIFHEVENILIDRGDLSAETGLMKLPEYQTRIIKSAVKAKKNVFLATQFLKNMQTHPVPLIAEAMDLEKTLNSDISGIQLSEETAIGSYPLECVEYVFNAREKIRPRLRSLRDTVKDAKW